ncbi:MAG TPA: hypothetical protein VET48_06890 [Steroidobacteraceae bacterium]|nr:hypothetical protein [Steroidobacteraceae bacterium]
MARSFKRYASFGREDKLVGIRAFFNGESIIVRLIIFLALGGIFYLVVQLTHSGVKPNAEQTEDKAVPAPVKPSPVK